MAPRIARVVLLAVFAILAAPWLPKLRADLPKTVAEKSDYQATSTHAQVVEFCEQLAKESPLVRLGELGTSTEGRKLPLLILADPPVATPEQAIQSKKLVVLAIGNIHAGEVDGKEALLMLARDIVSGQERALLKDLVIVFAPIFNADGNDKMGNNRPSQAGPPQVGTRANAQQLDLNRDFVKLESPEVRALVRLFNLWDPAVFIDCHTTNGSYHRYTLTYESGFCPVGDARLITFTRDEMLADVAKRLEKKTGFKSFFYGNFSADRTRWETSVPIARYGVFYVGVRNRIGILSESYSYSSYKDRVLASRGFVQSIIEYTADHKDQVRKLLDEVRDNTIRAGREPKADDLVALQFKTAPLGRPHQFLGYVEETRNGRRVPTEQLREYEVLYMGGTEATLKVRRPYAYLLPPEPKSVVEKLRQHGIEMEVLSESNDLDIEAYRIDKITRTAAFQKHQPLALEATARKEKRKIEAGTILVRTAHPLGSLAMCLLEPQSLDGLATWNFFDDVIQESNDFPVLRLPDPAVLKTMRLPN